MMGAIKLFLFPYGREPQELELRPHRLESSIVDAIKPTVNQVFNNLEYSGQLQLDHPHAVEDFQLYLNGSFVKTEYQPQNGTFSIKDVAFGAKLFIECYGYVQFSVRILLNEERFDFDTDYIPVSSHRVHFMRTYNAITFMFSSEETVRLPFIISL